MTMGYTAPSKAAIKRAIANGGALTVEVDGVTVGPVDILHFWRHVQETSMFGPEAKVPGRNLVVGPDAYSKRVWYGTITVNADGIVTKVE